MSLSLTATYTAISPNLTSSFLASGGVAPYTYSVVAGGAGGTINSSIGVYTAPSVYGIDTVMVTDSAASTVELQILIGTAIELVCDIIQTYMGLAQGQVYLFNQKINIPTDSNLYIAVGITSLKSFGNSNLSNNGIVTQGVNMCADLDINILSRSNIALNSKEQVLLALRSQYAQGQMEANSFFIAPLSFNFVNLSEVDGAAIPYRFVIGARLQYFVSVTSTPPYFSVFQTTEIFTNS